MRKISVFLLILGVLFFLVTSLSYAQVHKVKISELQEKVVDESPHTRREAEYQLHRLINPIFTNSPGAVIGSTWYEYQHNGTMSRMIAYDSSGGVHFNWMNGLETFPTAQRYVDYNYVDSAGNWLGALHVTPTNAAGGFTGIAGILSDGREVLCFHERDVKWPDPVARKPTLAVEKTIGGVGNFYRYDIPDSLPRIVERGMWPRAAIDSLNNIHVVMKEGETTLLEIHAFGYTRCYVDDTTLVCEAPGVDTVRIMPDTLTSYPDANLAAIYDSSATFSHTVVTSPLSKKVVIVYTKYTEPGDSASNDVYYIQSTNCGQDWIDSGGFETIEKHNITNYSVDDTIRAYSDVAAVYDYNNNLHILWTTHGYWEAQDSVTTDACFLWHWSEFSAITLVADGWKPSRPGDYNRTISKMSIGVNPKNNYLYAIWTQFDIFDTASNGFSNGEIYASASSDGGFTWDIPRNLTNTHTPGCDAGECESDHWSSLAEVVNDTLHIQYINDKDAGGAVLSEGTYTNNPVLYFKVPAWIPEIFPLTAKFSGNPRSGFRPLSVQFTDSSTGDPTSWLWDFGDGNTDTVQNPTHIYNDTGYFDVKLTVWNQEDSNTLIKPNYIGVLDTLTLDFTADPTQGRKPLTVAFQSIFNSTPDSVTWYFGDGDSSNVMNPAHKYTEFGNYDVKLVAELFGYRDSLTKEDYIQVSDIRAEFAADKRCGSAPLEVAFSDSSTGTYAITSWHWDFGDGDTSDQQNPTHQFTDTGVFDITLIVSDIIAADTLTKKDYITTQDSVSADFIGLPASGKSPLTVMFEPVLDGTANYYLWDFGDGDTSNIRNPIHIYAAQGEHDVKLVVKLELDECSQTDSMIKEDYIIVNDLEAQFSADPTAGIAPLIVQFTDQSTGNPDTWFWDFGDGDTNTEQNPQHQYDTAGVYDVFLRVSKGTFSDSLMKLDYIYVDDTSYTDLFCEYLYSGDSRPGFDAWLWPIWTNIGVIPADECTMKVLLPIEVTLIDLECHASQSGTCSPYSFLGDTIVVPLSTINPTNRWGGYLILWVNISETVQLGDTLVWEMWLTTTTPEVNYENNYCRLELEVTGSIDPNDKLAYPEGEGIMHAIEPDQRLSYTIQFENKPEATAEAIYIRVVDTLDQDLDWGTLAIGASSHPEVCDFEFDPYTGVIMWFCDSIMLPPNVNPPEGEGYFTFSISPEPGLPQGTEINNIAWIRFDYNEWLQAPEEGPVLRTIIRYICGDVNNDTGIDLSDVIYLANYILKGGDPPPDPIYRANADGDDAIDLSDAIYIANYKLKGGPAPHDCGNYGQ